MFKKTRMRMVMMNTAVLFLILCVFGGILYAYMHHYVYRGADDKLHDIARNLEREHYREVDRKHKEEREAERRVVYLLWGRDGQFIRSYPDNAIYPSDIPHFKPALSKGRKLWNQENDGNQYRIMNIHVANKWPSQFEVQEVQDLQLVLNIDPEVSLLHNLLMLIVAGALLGLITSLLAGLFLAERSLIPIKTAWDRQSRFVADASHELRTPLSVIQTHLELVFRHPSHTIEQESVAIYNSLKEVKRMNRLVADLLTLARKDSNEELLMREWFQLDVLANEVLDQFSLISETRNVRTIRQIEANLPLYGDKQRIHQLLIILLDNALKYNVDGGEIELLCKKNGNGLSMAVKDTGIGILHEELPFVFDRFFRGDKNRSREEEGTGLGLSIAKWIVEEHGGSMKVFSTFEKGSTFHIHFPNEK